MVSGGVKEASVQYQISRHFRAEPVPSEGGDVVEIDACPVGYKRTEVGVIPDDWDVKALSEFILALEAGISVNSVDRAELSTHDKFILKTSCIFGGYFDSKEAKSILPKDLNRAKLNPRKNSILVSRMNTPALVGEVGFIDDDYLNLYLPDRLWQTKYKNDGSIDGKWLSFILSFSRVAKKIKETATGTSNSMKNISKGDFLSVTVPAPEIKEQTAIANALSDVDALITALEKLITKKRAIKTAAMQQLLTGKKRFLPFDKTHTGYKQTELGEIPEDWEVVKLGDIGKNIIGLTYSPNDIVEYGSLVLRSSNVQNNKLAFENNVFVDMDLPKRVIVKEGDILICVRNGSKQLIGKCALIDKETEGSAFGAFMSIYRTEFSSFIFYQFQSNIIQRQIDEIMGATINQITNKDMAVFKVSLPNNSDEQVAIANVLSDMDKEIEALQQRLSKTQQLKQGMMQELLTGKTRLI